MRLFSIASVLFIFLTTPAYAQWLNHPTPGLPRGTDGQPLLSAPAPRTHDDQLDFSGVWAGGGSPYPPSSDLSPWVNQAIERHAENFYKERPMYQCLPSGPATFGQSTGGPVYKKIIQTPNLIVILNDDLTYRQIFLDGRSLEEEPFPSWMGYSVGRWEGETLVVESFGFNDKTWLNDDGLQHTEALRMTERYTRRDLGHLQIDVTFTDPEALLKPVSMTVDMSLAADTELLERVCETGSEDWSGTVSDILDAAVAVSPDILERYTGVFSGFWGANPVKVDVALENGQLVIHRNDGPLPMPLTPISDTLFQNIVDGLTYDFITNGDGPATDVVEIHVSGGYTFPRNR